MAIVLKKTEELIQRINEYLDKVVKGGLLFKQGLKYYFENRLDDFENRLEELNWQESSADTLRRNIESELYIHTLIPESRGDVLGIIESTDKVLNHTAKTLLQFSIEMPRIPQDLHPYFLDLAEQTVAAVDSMVMAIQAYFHDKTVVRDYISKVSFFEKECDKIAEKIMRTIFRKEMELSHKMHIRNYAHHIDRIADEAEDVCDRLSIAAIKRQV
ncbi:MAG: hypothetical protein Kow0042_29430 [Calditrichia bacterium]